MIGMVDHQGKITILYVGNGYAYQCIDVNLRIYISGLALRVVDDYQSLN